MNKGQLILRQLKRLKGRIRKEPLRADLEGVQKSISQDGGTLGDDEEVAAAVLRHPPGLD